MAVATIHRLEKLFRRAADLDFDKSDFVRLESFVRRKIDDLIVRGEANAKANRRDVVQGYPSSISFGQSLTAVELSPPLSFRSVRSLHRLSAIPPPCRSNSEYRGTKAVSAPGISLPR